MHALGPPEEVERLVSIWHSVKLKKYSNTHDCISFNESKY